MGGPFTPLAARPRFDLFADAAALREAQALLAVERAHAARLRQRTTWLEHRVVALEHALAAAEGRAPHLAALTHATA